jgi:rare lipoprotein A
VRHIALSGHQGLLQGDPVIVMETASMAVQPASSVAFFPVPMMSRGVPTCRLVVRVVGISSVALLLANCASEPTRGQRQLSAQNQREIGAFSNKAKYGSASPRVVQYGETVPKGGGRDHVGRPYKVAGRWYTPRENPNYSSTGHASWYGDAFHGRKTANGEIYDKYAYTAAHPTMPLPSYARVTNLGNGHSIVVRVNDRGPFHGGRIIDLSERVAHALNFKHIGTARVKVDYLQRASTAGSDDRKLVATLRTDGQMAELPGGATPIPAGQPIMVASASPTFIPQAASPAPRVPQQATPARPIEVAAQPSVQPTARAESEETLRIAETRQLRRDIPLPPERPFDLGSIPGAATPLARVNNGQGSPLPQQRVASAAFFAPTTGFAQAIGRDDPMAKLRPGRFAAVEHKLAATPAADPRGPRR